MLGDLFDPKAELLVHERLRPHWSQAGAIVFVTFRTADSIPKKVLARWQNEKREWILKVLNGCESRFDAASSLLSAKGRSGASDGPIQWSLLLPLLSEMERYAFDFHFHRLREWELDKCHGECVLKRPALARIVADSLMHFDGQKYRMGDFVVMPNHVHLLAAFPSMEAMERQFDSWLHYTAVRIHASLGVTGHFWQQEPFDHLVRSVEQYEYLRNYIARNPGRARLKPGEFMYRRLDG